MFELNKHRSAIKAIDKSIEILNLDDLSIILGSSPDTLRKRATRGSLPSRVSQIGRKKHYSFLTSELREFYHID